MSRTGNKRHICCYVQEDKKGNFNPHVVVVAAPNLALARAKLCVQHKVRNHDIGKERKEKYTEGGIRTIRVCETNIYEGEKEEDNFSDYPETRR